MMQKGIAPILIVILVAILGIGGYFVYMSLRGVLSGVEGDVAISPTISSTPKPTESTSSAETANWNTFKDVNNNGLFEVKYPSTWTLIGKTGGGGPLISPVEESKIFDSSAISFEGPYINPQDTSEKIASGGIDGGLGGKVTSVKREEIKLGGKRTIKQHAKVETIGTLKKTYYVTGYFIDLQDVYKQTATLSIYIRNYEGIYPSKNQEIFDQILSTFKFTQ